MNDKISETWLFDGPPEFVDINVAPASLNEGGYVVAMLFATGTIRIAATRHPAKYVNNWRHNARRFDTSDVIRVLVSRPYLRYEAVKRCLVNLLAGHKDADAEIFRVEIDTLTARLAEC